MTTKYCTECGNILHNGRCSRCDANTFTRQRRWRKGDRGGKRPERRQSRRQLLDALDGTWTNSRHHITIYFDTEQGTYRSVHGRYKDTAHVFRFQEEKDGSIYFYKDSLLIEAIVSDMGFLIMHSNDKRMSFAYEYEEELFRTCPICYGKSTIEYDNCSHCKWEFEPYL